MGHSWIKAWPNHGFLFWPPSLGKYWIFLKSFSNIGLSHLVSRYKPASSQNGPKQRLGPFWCMCCASIRGILYLMIWRSRSNTSWRHGCVHCPGRLFTVWNDFGTRADVITGRYPVFYTTPFYNSVCSSDKTNFEHLPYQGHVIPVLVIYRTFK